MNTELLDKAIIFATKAHAGTQRRGKEFPYIVHPMEAVAIASTMTSDQELLAAAALHDTIEDTEVTYEDILKEFGPKVASLVKTETDEESQNVDWHTRKRKAMDKIAASSREEKIVAMSDKLSNMRAIWRDYKTIGDDIWNLFHTKEKSEHEWHYRQLAASLSELSDTFAYKEFNYLLDDVFGPEI